jgi:tripeptide aminopeptidase
MKPVSRWILLAHFFFLSSPLLEVRPVEANAQEAKVREVIANPSVAEGLQWLKDNFESQVAEWIKINEIPAPSGMEELRGAYVADAMRAEGLDVSIDGIGNVIGRRAGAGDGPTLVFAAHIDNAYSLDVDVTVRRDRDTLRAPGIFNNAASVANMLATIRALNRSGIQTKGDLVFIGTVQEEVGFRGMHYWLDENQDDMDMLIAIDGALGLVRYGALGIYWTKYHFLADGAHTNVSAGRPHPIRALAHAVTSIYEIEIPGGPTGTVYNVGILEAGAVFNALPQRASFSMDLRSTDPLILDSLNAEIQARVAAAAEAHGVDWYAEEASRSPAGGTEEQLRHMRHHPLVVTAEAVYHSLGIEYSTLATGSTEANAGVVRGLPSISMGRGYGGETYTTREWADIPSALQATLAVFLIAVSLSGIAD